MTASAGRVSALVTGAVPRRLFCRRRGRPVARCGLGHHYPPVRPAITGPPLELPEGPPRFRAKSRNRGSRA